MDRQPKSPDLENQPCTENIREQNRATLEVRLLETGAKLLKEILIRSSVRPEKILHPKQQSVGN